MDRQPERASEQPLPTYFVVPRGACCCAALQPPRQDFRAIWCGLNLEVVPPWYARRARAETAGRPRGQETRQSSVNVLTYPPTEAHRPPPRHPGRPPRPGRGPRSAYAPRIHELTWSKHLPKRPARRAGVTRGGALGEATDWELAIRRTARARGETHTVALPPWTIHGRRHSRTHSMGVTSRDPDWTQRDGAPARVSSVGTARDAEH